MIIFFEIPFILILVVIALIIGGVYQIVSHIFEILLWLLLIAIDLGIYILLMKLYYKVYEKLKSVWFWINVISITIFWFFGILVFLELREIDIQGLGKYMDFLGDKEVIRYLILPVGTVLFIYIICLLVAYSCESKVVRSLLCITPILLVCLFYKYSGYVCTKSFSDKRVEEFMAMEDIEEQIIKEEAEIYYSLNNNVWNMKMGGKPYERKSVALFPGMSPIKYSRTSFQKGEKVYVRNVIKTNLLKTENYVEASNGEEVGYINVKNLELEDIYDK